jgi:long-chain acyl-CoA synthetase
MYTGKHVHLPPLQPAFIMASTGEAVTYRDSTPIGTLSY